MNEEKLWFDTVSEESVMWMWIYPEADGTWPWNIAKERYFAARGIRYPKPVEYGPGTPFAEYDAEYANYKREYDRVHDLMERETIRLSQQAIRQAIQRRKSTPCPGHKVVHPKAALLSRSRHVVKPIR